MGQKGVIMYNDNWVSKVNSLCVYIRDIILPLDAIIYKRKSL